MFSLKDLGTIILGIISGLIAVISMKITGIDIIPGFIFGIFTIPYIWKTTSKYKKIISYFLISGLSYIGAYYTGLYIILSEIFTNKTILLYIGLSIAGGIGCLILLSLHHFIITKISIKLTYIILIFTICMIIPPLILAIIGVQTRDTLFFGDIASPKAGYFLIMMPIWQGIMLYTISKLPFSQIKQ